MGTEAVDKFFSTYIQISFEFSARENHDTRVAIGLKIYILWNVVVVSTEYNMTAIFVAQMNLFDPIF